MPTVSKQHLVVSAFLLVILGMAVGSIFTLGARRTIERGHIKRASNAEKGYSKCRTILASKDSQTSVDLMNILHALKVIEKRSLTLVPLAAGDAELKAEIKWLVHTSMRIERQGMVGCTYKRNRRGKLRKCSPKFNLSDCKKSKGYWICPIPEPSVVKGKGRR